MLGRSEANPYSPFGDAIVQKVMCRRTGFTPANRDRPFAVYGKIDRARHRRAP
jgi:hypothetical protein